MNKLQAQNVVAILQQEPLYYRNFGVWWWHVKSELKRLGYTKENLQHLGDDDDPSVSAYYEGLTVRQRDDEAFYQQYEMATGRRNYNISESPTGETYMIVDTDAE